MTISVKKQSKASDDILNSLFAYRLLSSLVTRSGKVFKRKSVKLQKRQSQHHKIKEVLCIYLVSKVELNGREK